MTHHRHINKVLLKFLIKEIGLERIAVAADCSASLLQKLVSDSYETIPSIRKIDGICSATGHSIEDLFPLVQIEEEAS